MLLTAIVVLVTILRVAGIATAVVVVTFLASPVPTMVPIAVVVTTSSFSTLVIVIVTTSSIVLLRLLVMVMLIVAKLGVCASTLVAHG